MKKVTDKCIDCGKIMLSECFLHEAYCETCDVDCPTCVTKDLTEKPTPITKEKLAEKIHEEIEKGWLPSYLRDVGCSCHINPPCSKHCLDGDYDDEFCEEFNLVITE